MSKTAPRTLLSLTDRLPHPAQPLLHGRRSDGIVLPENLACFQRSETTELNQPRRGRALHHRCVLIIPLEGTVTLWVDDREITLGPPRGLLILPFQFHHYLPARDMPLRWLFVTFEYIDPDALAGLRYQPFALTRPLRQLVTELVAAYETSDTADLPVLLLAVLLARLRSLKPTSPERTRHRVAAEPSLVTKVNLLADRSPTAVGVKELAAKLGISSAHLRARFHASCGTSLGRHLRRLRLERACGLLRMSNARVSEIAEKCGFNSIYSFSRAFRTAYGVSPLRYRRSGQRLGGAGNFGDRRNSSLNPLESGDRLGASSP